MTGCELTDQCASTLGEYFKQKQVGYLKIGGNKLTFKGIAKLIEDLNTSAESGRLKGLDISDTIADDPESKKK